MIVSRLSLLAVALLTLASIACASEDVAEPSQAVASALPTVDPAQSPAQTTASARPTTAPTQVSSPAQTTASARPTTAPTQVSSPTAAPTAAPEELDLDIVTLLPFDAIPAVLDPVFISAEDAEAELTKRSDDPNDALVLGLSINGDSRAYYVPSLSRVEIINDTVGGQPLAVTW